VFVEPTFPVGVLRILLAPDERGHSDDIIRCSSWAAISEIVFNAVR
jgi:hypothetical protein